MGFVSRGAGGHLRLFLFAPSGRRLAACQRLQTKEATRRPWNGAVSLNKRAVWPEGGAHAWHEARRRRRRRRRAPELFLPAALSARVAALVFFAQTDFYEKKKIREMGSGLIRSGSCFSAVHTECLELQLGVNLKNDSLELCMTDIRPRGQSQEALCAAIHGRPGRTDSQIKHKCRIVFVEMKKMYWVLDECGGKLCIKCHWAQMSVVCSYISGAYLWFLLSGRVLFYSQNCKILGKCCLENNGTLNNRSLYF